MAINGFLPSERIIKRKLSELIKKQERARITIEKTKKSLKDTKEKIKLLLKEEKELNKELKDIRWWDNMQRCD